MVNSGFDLENDGDIVVFVVHWTSYCNANDD